MRSKLKKKIICITYLLIRKNTYEEKYVAYVSKRQQPNRNENVSDPLVFNERRGNPHTTEQAAAGLKTSLYTDTAKECFFKNSLTSYNIYKAIITCHYAVLSNISLLEPLLYKSLVIMLLIRSYNLNHVHIIQKFAIFI